MPQPFISECMNPVCDNNTTVEKWRKMYMMNSMRRTISGARLPNAAEHMMHARESGRNMYQQRTDPDQQGLIE